MKSGAELCSAGDRKLQNVVRIKKYIYATSYIILCILYYLFIYLFIYIINIRSMYINTVVKKSISGDEHMTIECNK